ncbi:hypothetical protein QJS04_geneDACA012796 [Acorus gramineus]|uniref:Uncharacterized protein n=1 Tax=Acorus gramineus TaxID=55184 RepID=A0AAV9BH68_ACOGR|nr:hypothetical protein QJS04_geneDACA012796 [Acorus gramineus]
MSLSVPNMRVTETCIDRVIFNTIDFQKWTDRDRPTSVPPPQKVQRKNPT